MTRTLKFVNTYHVETGEDKQPMEIELEIGDKCDYKQIMEWYGAFYAGDPYRVYLNGHEVKTDLNGCLDTSIIEGKISLKKIDQVFPISMRDQSNKGNL